MIDFIDKTSEQNGTPINRESMMAIQGYQYENVTFENGYKKVNGKGETEIVTFNENGYTKQFVGEKTITQKVTFTENGYEKELS